MADYKPNIKQNLSKEELDELQEYVYKYLDKRYTIKGKEIRLTDEKPNVRLKKAFGVNGNIYLFTWAMERVGESFTLIYPSGVKKMYENTTLIAHIDKNGKARRVENGKLL